MMKRLTTLFAALALAALGAACGGSDNTTTTTNRTTNTTNTSNANTNTNANANTHRGEYNANISQGDYEKDKDVFSQKAKDAGDKIGSAATDGWLWVKTRGALMAADDLEESGINVDVNNGVIVLRGTVPNNDQVKKADAAAKGVGGSKGVQNQLKVGGGDANANKTATSNKKK
jgi:hypothetical protein